MLVVHFNEIKTKGVLASKPKRYICLVGDIKRSRYGFAMDREVQASVPFGATGSPFAIAKERGWNWVRSDLTGEVATASRAPPRAPDGFG